MESNVRVFESALEMATVLAGEIKDLVITYKNQNKPFHIAVSGGNTPKILYEVLASEYNVSMPWDSLKIFFVDERCVPPEHPESNYGMCMRSLFSKVNIPGENIFRMMGEAEPRTEALRYASLVKSRLPDINSIPKFDLILLGLGEDGHTASIFPNQMSILQSDKICETTVHPQSDQRRITLTGQVINNAELVIFLVTGSNKSRIARSVIHERKRFYPASHIKPVSGKLIWMVDKAVARGM